MADLMIVCKSYQRDVLRVRRLLDSLGPHNVDRIPVAVVVPRSDLALFRETLAGRPHELVADEDVVASHPEASARNLLERYARTRGYLSQQVVKSEAWRLLGCDAYLCVDSDSVLIRPFRRSDLLTPAGHPFSLVHQSKEFLQLAVNRGHAKVADDYLVESRKLRQLFGRDGPDYDFGPPPLPWSARVWNSLHERFLAPRDWTLWDAIDFSPNEIRWYGEALLAFRAIPVDPIEPLFRFYHYEWQWLVQRRLGETEATLASQFFGVVYQSNWEFELDAPGARSALSTLARRLKRWRQQWRARR